MPFDNFLALSAVFGLFGLVILIVLWPGERQGQRLLRRWGIQDPSNTDVNEAVRYLKQRRFWYPWVFFLVPAVSGLLGQPETEKASLGSIAWTVLIGGLLGEVLALRPVKAEHRQATRTRRRVFDLVPAWALGLLAVAAMGGTAYFVTEHRYVSAGAAAGFALVAVGITALALERPAAGDPVVDLVLRIRSARVATGLAIALPGALLVHGALTAAKVLVGVLSLAALIAVVNPSPRLAATMR